MSEPTHYTAITPVFNSMTGVLYQAGDLVPVEGNEEMFEPDANGKVPGFDPAEQRATETHVAGQDNAVKGAGQNGQPPAKKKAAAKKPSAETIEQLEGAVDVEEGGKPRTKDTAVGENVVTPEGGKIEKVSPSALD